MGKRGNNIREAKVRFDVLEKAMHQTIESRREKETTFCRKSKIGKITRLPFNNGQWTEFRIDKSLRHFFYKGEKTTMF